MLLEIEIRRHPPLALDPAAERDAHEVSVQFISPLMINAFEMRHIALACAAYRRAAMRAAVHNDMEALVLVPRHNDRRVADEGRFEITGVRDFALARNEVPGGAREERLGRASWRDRGWKN